MTSQHPKIDSRGLDRRSNPVTSKLALLATCGALAFLAACGGGEKAPEAGGATPPEEPATPPATAVEEAPAAADETPAPAAPAAAAAAPPATGGSSGDFAAEAAKRVSDEQPNVQGDDPAWFFLGNELRQVGHGAFWETGWSGTETGGTKLDTGIDPTPSMVEFHKLLEARGVELIVVPIPAKASIYPGKLASGFAPGAATALTPYLAKMKEQGLNVIDLEPIMLKHRADNPGEKLWCEQDAHYSPRAIEIIAELLKQEIAGKDWYAAAEKVELTRSEPKELKIEGDQIVGSPWAGKVPKEALTVRYVGTGPAGGGALDPVEPDVNSPILLVGDSHTLVFQEGASSGMHCQGAGLLDQLAFELQVIPDHVGVRGSGLMQARRNLFQKAAANPGYWDNKKLVIWVFSVREFTQSFDRIISIPIER